MPNYDYLNNMGVTLPSGSDILSNLVRIQNAHDAQANQYINDMSMAAALSGGIEDPVYKAKVQEMQNYIQEAADFLAQNGLTPDRQRRLLNEKLKFNTIKGELEAARLGRQNYITSYENAIKQAQSSHDTLLPILGQETPYDISYDEFLGGKTPVYSPVTQSAVQDTLRTTYGKLLEELNLNIPSLNAAADLNDYKKNNFKRFVTTGNAAAGYNSIYAYLKELGLNKNSLNLAYEYIDGNQDNNLPTSLKNLLSQWVKMLKQQYPMLGDDTVKTQLKISLGDIVGGQQIDFKPLGTPGDPNAAITSPTYGKILEDASLVPTYTESISVLSDEELSKQTSIWRSQFPSVMSEDGEIKIDLSSSGTGVAGMPSGLSSHLMSQWENVLPQKGVKVEDSNVMKDVIEKVVSSAELDNDLLADAARAFGYEVNDGSSIIEFWKSVLPMEEKETDEAYKMRLRQYILASQLAHVAKDIAYSDQDLSDMQDQYGFIKSEDFYNFIQLMGAKYGGITGTDTNYSIYTASPVPIVTGRNMSSSIKSIADVFGIDNGETPSFLINAFTGTAVPLSEVDTVKGIIDSISEERTTFGDLLSTDLHISHSTPIRMKLSDLATSTWGITQNSTPYVLSKDGTFAPVVNEKPWQAFYQNNLENNVNFRIGIRYTENGPEYYAMLSDGYKDYAFRIDTKRLSSFDKVKKISELQAKLIELVRAKKSKLIDEKSKPILQETKTASKMLDYLLGYYLKQSMSETDDDQKSAKVDDVAPIIENKIKQIYTILTSI